MNQTFEMRQVRATQRHIHQVGIFLETCIADLVARMRMHDDSKFDPSEWSYFVAHTETLAGLTYNSPEYKAELAAMRPAIELHYKSNRHHPEHHEKGIAGMNLLDLLEMICDWLAATQRHDDGDITKSIEQNKDRFGYSAEIEAILKNTASFLQMPESPPTRPRKPLDT